MNKLFKIEKYHHDAVFGDANKGYYHTEDVNGVQLYTSADSWLDDEYYFDSENEADKFIQQNVKGIYYCGLGNEFEYCFYAKYRYDVDDEEYVNEDEDGVNYDFVWEKLKPKKR